MIKTVFGVKLDHFRRVLVLARADQIASLPLAEAPSGCYELPRTHETSQIF